MEYYSAPAGGPGSPRKVRLASQSRPFFRGHTVPQMDTILKKEVGNSLIGDSETLLNNLINDAYLPFPIDDDLVKAIKDVHEQRPQCIKDYGASNVEAAQNHYHSIKFESNEVQMAEWMNKMATVMYDYYKRSYMDPKSDKFDLKKLKELEDWKILHSWDSSSSNVCLPGSAIRRKPNNTT